MSDNIVPGQLAPTILGPVETTSDSSVRSSPTTTTTIRSLPTQSSTTSVVAGKEQPAAGRDEGPSRPVTPKPAYTWPTMAKEDSEKQSLDDQLAKDKVYIKKTPANCLPGPTFVSQALGTKEVSAIPVAPSSRPESSVKEEFQKMYRREARFMTQRLKAREIQRMCHITPSNDTEFSEYWEQSLLPQVVHILESNIQGAYHINVRKGHGPHERVIDVTTKDNCARVYSEQLKAAKDMVLPEDLSSKTQFDFRDGERVYCIGELNVHAPLLPDDATTTVANPHYYGDNPVMGDSVGTTSNDGGSATLGPLLEIDRRFYRLVNWHLFDDDKINGIRQCNSPTPPSLDLVHPSPDDLESSSSGRQLVEIGKTVAFSGLMYKTSRPISPPGALANPRVTTDWDLCETKESGVTNQIRHVMTGEWSKPLETGITEIAPMPKVGDVVYSAGRSSGYTLGRICQRGYSKNNDGSIVRDWAVSSVEDEDGAWLEGMGIQGDSGAGIMNLMTNQLVGQLWGRNHHQMYHEKPAMTYFTAISDVFDDIQERWPGGQCSRPKLPGETQGGTVDGRWLDEDYTKQITHSILAYGIC
ncbi:zinc finger protein [Apiospora saccharicola]|uniref:Zinc finger protein n=1 Tax=Apiospora saccharicola TaxID=335842 RepID=A0ABR1TJR6_9PEZI